MLQSYQLERVVMETAKWRTQDSSFCLSFFLLGVTSFFARGAIFNGALYKMGLLCSIQCVIFPPPHYSLSS